MVESQFKTQPKCQSKDNSKKRNDSSQNCIKFMLLYKLLVVVCPQIFIA